MGEQRPRYDNYPDPHGDDSLFAEVTIIPTYDTDVLGYWVAENEELLAELRIDLAPSASRCTINLQVSAGRTLLPIVLQDTVNYVYKNVRVCTN